MSIVVKQVDTVQKSIRIQTAPIMILVRVHDLPSLARLWDHHDLESWG